MKIDELMEMLEAFADICDGNVYIDGKEVAKIIVNCKNPINTETSINISTI